MIDELMATIRSLEGRINQLERRQRNMFREGVIKSTDYEKGLAVMEAGGIETLPSPWLSRAGAVRDWNPVTDGERAVYISPSGEPGQGMILPGGFSSAFPQNHNKGAEPTRTVGSTTLRQTGSSFEMTVGGVGFFLDSTGVTWTVPAGGHRVNP